MMPQEEVRHGRGNEATLAAVSAERAATMEDLRGERRALLDAVHRERVAALAEIEAMTQRLVDRSGATIHDASRTELTNLAEAVEAMRKRLIDDSGVALNEVVDHAFLKALQLVLIAAVLGATGAVLYARFLRRHG